MSAQPPPKSESYRAFEAALDSAQHQHQRAMDARRAKRRPIGFALLAGGLALLAGAGVLFVGLATGDARIMMAVYATALLVGGITTSAKGISMIAGRG